MRAFLFHSDVLKENEIVAFRHAYDLLCQRVVHNRIGKLEISYKVIQSAIKRDKKIARAFYGILKYKKGNQPFNNYCADIKNLIARNNQRLK